MDFFFENFFGFFPHFHQKIRSLGSIPLDPHFSSSAESAVRIPHFRDNQKIIFFSVFFFLKFWNYFFFEKIFLKKKISTPKTRPYSLKLVRILIESNRLEFLYSQILVKLLEFSKYFDQTLKIKSVKFLKLTKKKKKKSGLQSILRGEWSSNRRSRARSWYRCCGLNRQQHPPQLDKPWKHNKKCKFWRQKLDFRKKKKKA